MAKPKKAPEIEPVKFWRHNKPNIVWDVRNNRPLCDFSQGVVITDDPYTIETLRELDYMEVPLESQMPPDIPEPIQPKGMKDVKGVPDGLTEEMAAKTIARRTKKVRQEDQHGPAVDPPKVAGAKKKAPAKEPAAKKRSIKRRKK